VSFSLFVFDLDGTLVDSRQDLADSANLTLESYGYPRLPVDVVAAMVGEGARVLLDRAFARHGGAAPEDALETFLRVYDDRLVVNTHVYPGVPGVVVDLASQGRVAVLTNKPQRPAERLLAHFDLAPYVFRVIGGDGAIPRKPDPAGLHALMADAGASAAATLLIGDSWIDHETGVRAGVRVCLAKYGFGFDQISAGRLRGDEILVDAPQDILEYV
jgi:phosphoglycolate phosphatase